MTAITLAVVSDRSTWQLDLRGIVLPTGGIPGGIPVRLLCGAWQ